MQDPDPRRITAPKADNERAVIMALHAYRLFAAPIRAVYVDERCELGQILHGHAETLVGHLGRDEVVMHPDTAAEHARPFLGPVAPYLKKVPAMADGIVTKHFTRKRVEYWIPTGTYHGDGERFALMNQAYAWARKQLIDAGVIDREDGDEEHIRIKPHDEHVIVYIEFDEEQTK